MFVHIHDIALLNCLASEIARASGHGFRIDELTASDGGSVEETHSAIGHRIARGRAAQRFGNGLRFIRLWRAEELMGSTWICAGARYVDELNWLLPIGPHEFWIRDVFVAPNHRGGRIFSTFVRLIAERDGYASIWSDVDWNNEGSMRAHRAAGFQVRARARALDFRGRLRWRSSLVQWALPVTEIDPESRLIWLRGPKLQRHRELVA